MTNEQKKEPKRQPQLQPLFTTYRRRYGIWDNSSIPRREYGKPAFAVLRRLVQISETAQKCIALRQHDMQSYTPIIIHTDPRKQAAYQSVCSRIERFFRHPDPYNRMLGLTDSNYTTWIGKLVDWLLVYNAVALYNRPTRGTPFPHSLEPIDVRTLKPITDEDGRIVACQQYIDGKLWGTYSTIGHYDEYGAYHTPEIIWVSRNQADNTPYGIAPIETVANAVLRQHNMTLEEFYGTITHMVTVTNEEDMPFEIDDFNTIYSSQKAMMDSAKMNALGDSVLFSPFNYKPHRLEERIKAEERIDEDKYLQTRIAIAFDVSPLRLGIQIDKEPRATSEAQMEITLSEGAMKLADWFRDTIFLPIVHGYFNQPDLRVIFAYEAERQSEKYYRAVDAGVLRPEDAAMFIFGGTFEASSVQDVVEEQADEEQQSENKQALQKAIPKTKQNEWQDEFSNTLLVYLGELQTRLVEESRRWRQQLEVDNTTPFSGVFWAKELNRLTLVVQPLIQKMFMDVVNDKIRTTDVADPAKLQADAIQNALRYTQRLCEDFIVATRESVMQIVSMWANPDTTNYTIDDLKAFLTPLLSENTARCDTVARAVVEYIVNYEEQNNGRRTYF